MQNQRNIERVQCPIWSVPAASSLSSHSLSSERKSSSVPTVCKSSTPRTALPSILLVRPSMTGWGSFCKKYKRKEKRREGHFTKQQVTSKRGKSHFKVGPTLEAILDIFGHSSLISGSWKNMKKRQCFCPHAQCSLPSIHKMLKRTPRSVEIDFLMKCRRQNWFAK